MIFSFFKKESPLPEVLYFKSERDAFEYSCNYSLAEVRAGHPRVALVEETSGVYDKKGIQNVFLRVAGNNDYFNVFSSTAAPFVPLLAPGDLVLWLPMELGPMALGVTDKRKTWLGLIVAVLAPEMIVKTHNYRIKIDHKDYVRRQ